MNVCVCVLSYYENLLEINFFLLFHLDSIFEIQTGSRPIQSNPIQSIHLVCVYVGVCPLLPLCIYTSM